MLTFERTAAQTNGEELRFIAELAAGARVPMHVHPLQEENFEIIEGSPLFVVDGEEIRAAPGRVLTVPAQIPHRFHNDTGQIVRLRATLRPALSSEVFFEDLFALDRRGGLRLGGMPSPRQGWRLIRDHRAAFPWPAAVPSFARRLLAGA